MKARKLSIALGLLTMGIVLSSCGDKTTIKHSSQSTTVVTSNPTSAPTNIQTTTSMTSENKPFDKDKGYDEITRTHKLTKDYKGKSFIDDGIGEVTLASLGDGDTAVFELKVPGDNGVVLPRIRFAGVDTPEATAQVEKWGKYASKFTGAALENAVEIVLEATNVPAEKDSGGTRYMGYVWYKSSATDDFKMLNLELVENGYSPANEYGTKLESVFKEAETFAKEHEMHIWSADIDPYYSTDITKVTLKELIADINDPYLNSQYYNHDEDVGANIRFEAFVINHETTNSGTNYFTVGQYDEDGKLYTFRLYSGYSSDAINSYVIVGGIYHFYGNVQKYHDDWQIAVGKTYIAMEKGDNRTYQLQKEYYCQFDSSNELYESKRETGVKSYLTVTNVTFVGTTLIIVGTAQNYTAATTTEIFVLKINVESNPNFTVKVGDKLQASGILEQTDSNVYNTLIENISVK